MSRIYTGQTFRATVSDLTDPGGVALNAPTVAITLYDPDDGVINGTVIQSGTTYYADFASAVVGKHVVRAAATASTGIWKEEGQLQVYDFAT